MQVKAWFVVACIGSRLPVLVHPSLHRLITGPLPGVVYPWVGPSPTGDVVLTVLGGGHRILVNSYESFAFGRE